MGPASQLAFIPILLMSLYPSPRRVRSILRPKRHRKFFVVPRVEKLFDPAYLQDFPRQSGIGSLPSARATMCTGWMVVVLVWEDVLGMALQIPISANAASNTSAIRAMGEVSLTRVSRVGAEYMPKSLCRLVEK